MSLGFAEGAQPDPPGLIHDDPRLLPPGGGRPFSRVNLARLQPRVVRSRTLSTDPSLRLAVQCRRDTVGRCDHRCRGILAVWRTRSSRGARPDRGGRRCAGRSRRKTSPISRKAWSAATAVVLDEVAAEGCARPDCPAARTSSWRPAANQPPATWAAAIEVGARQVLRLPAQERDLVRELADAGESVRDDGARGAMVAVIGGCGGAGASLFAAALA